jgi:hypothetical protein
MAPFEFHRCYLEAHELFGKFSLVVVILESITGV